MREENNLKSWQLVNFCEFDKYAIKSYCAIHDVDASLNLGDITEVDETKLEDFNMMTWGFPCTDISCAGKQKGFIDEEGNKTRSGMYYEGIRILRYKKPALSIIENVKNLTSKKFKKEFETVLSDLDEAGYNSYYKILNAKDFGVPQNRERVFIISIRKDLDNGKFVFPKGFNNGIRLKDILEDEVDEKYYISNDNVQKFLDNLDLGSGGLDHKIIQVGKLNSSQDGVVVSPDGIAKTHTAGHNNTPKIIQIGIDKSTNETKAIEKANCITAREDRGISNRKSEGTAILEVEPINTESDGTCRTIKAQYYKTSLANYKRTGDMGATGVTNGIAIRKLTPKECFRLMGFSDLAYEAAGKVVSNSQLYKQSGNSIVVDVLYYILVELYKAIPYLFDDLKLSSFFSGIGAFEVALDRLYESINTGNFFKPQAE